MKKIIFALMLLSASGFIYSQTPAQKTAAAQLKFAMAKKNLDVARFELNATYPAYKVEAKELIKSNDKKIADLRSNFVIPRSSALNDASKRMIDTLENVNIELRDRLFIVEE